MSANAPVFLDGQTRSAFIGARERLHGELQFDFRPMTYEEVEKVETLLSSYGAPHQVGNRIAAIVGVIVKQVTGWSEIVPHTADNVKRLHPRLLNRVFLIVMGQDAGDPPKGTAPKGEAIDDYTVELLAAGEGKNLVALRESETAKN